MEIKAEAMALPDLTRTRRTPKLVAADPDVNLVTAAKADPLASSTSPNGMEFTASRQLRSGVSVTETVGAAPSGLEQASATVPVILQLPDPSVASELALASEAGKIDLLREGTRAGAPIPPARVGG